MLTVVFASCPAFSPGFVVVCEDDPTQHPAEDESSCAGAIGIMSFRVRILPNSAIRFDPFRWVHQVAAAPESALSEADSRTLLRLIKALRVPWPDHPLATFDGTSSTLMMQLADARLSLGWNSIPDEWTGIREVQDFFHDLHARYGGLWPERA